MSTILNLQKLCQEPWPANGHNWKHVGRRSGRNKWQCTRCLHTVWVEKVLGCEWYPPTELSVSKNYQSFMRRNCDDIIVSHVMEESDEEEST